MDSAINKNGANQDGACFYEVFMSLRVAAAMAALGGRQ
jgi:hypothetical protein